MLRSIRAAAALRSVNALQTPPARRHWAAAVSRVCAVLVALVLSLGQARAQSQAFTTAGNATWTAPAGVTSVQVQAWGSGGGSGGAGAHFASTGGGSGGSFVQFTMPVSPGTTYNLTVGAGGSAGAGGAANSGSAGGAGGASFFGNTTAGSPTGASVIAAGGTGSIGNNVTGTSTTNRTATAGATAPTSGNFPSSGSGLVSYFGTSGANAVTNTNNSGAGGAGAGPTGPSNGGAGGAALTSAGNGNPGTAPGGGGGGADQSSGASNGTGAVGGAGEILLTYTSPSSITTSGSISAFTSTYGTASTPKSFTVSGTSLTANVVVTPPAGFEVSASLGSGYGSSLTLTESGGTLAPTSVYVRVASATVPGSYSGNVTLTSTGAATQNVAIPASTVSPLALTLSAAAVTSKSYDGTTTAVITGTLVGVITPDVVALVGSGTFAQATSGTAISVISTSILSGANASNYTLTQPTGLTGTISPSANLGNLALSANSSALAFSPAFSAGTTRYSVSVSHTVSSVTLSVAADSGSSVTVNGNNSSTPVNLSPGANTVNISVTNGGTTQTYTLIITQMLPFTPGNLIIESIDNSSASTITMYELATGAANAIQTPVQSFVVPSTGSSALRQSNAGTTARIGLTNDGTLMAFTGFEDATGFQNGSAVTDETSIAQRGVATLDIDYNYAVQASYTSTTASGDQVRTATSVNDTVWYLDDKSGIYLANGTFPTNGTNCVVVKSFGGAVYALSQKASNLLSTLSTDGTTLTGLTGLTSDGSAVDFYLLSSGTQGNLYDILYVLDGTTVTKYCYSQSNSTWSICGSAVNIGGLTGIGMCAASTATGATLFITTETSTGTSGTVLQLTDAAGYGAAPAITTANNVTLYSSTAFLKGVSLVPRASALPDLTVGVSAPVIVASGANFTYTIFAANSGAAQASGVSVQFTLPAGLTFVSGADTGSAGFTASNNSGVVTFSGGTLAANASETLSVTVNGPDSTYISDAGTAPATNHGFAVINPSGSVAESNSENDNSNVGATTHVGTVPYLAISISGSSSAVANSPGNPIVYTIVAQNQGNAAATGASVQFALPSGLTLLSAVDTGSAGFTSSTIGNTITFSGGTLAPSSSETLTVTAEASTSTYQVYSVDLPAGAAVIAAGNVTGSTSSTGTVVTSVTLPSGADLVVESTPSGPILAGDSADNLTLYVSNDGTGSTSGSVTLTDTLPAGLAPAAAMNGATVNGWTVAVSGQTVTATRADTLFAGAEYPAVAGGLNFYPALTLTFSVASSASGVLTNNATVSGGGAVFTANNSATNMIAVGTPTPIFSTGYLLVSRGHYLGANITAGSTILPNGAIATASGAYPNVWQNEAPDVSFGVTGSIYIDVVSKTDGSVASSSNITSLISTELGINVTTSFSSKSEVSLSLTPDGKGVTFSGYIAPAETLDVSNANTPYHEDPTSPLAGHGDFQKAIVLVDYMGNVQVTPNDSYSGDNCRAAVLAEASDGNSYYFTAGSAGNSGAGVTGTTMTMLAQDTGIQMVLPGAGGLMTAVGEAFGTANATAGYQLGYDGLSTDKTGKDMNLRSLTLNPFNNTLYSSKGSGGSGVNTVYQIGSGGIPTPASAGSIAYAIPSGLPTASGSGLYPFGIWFANAYTMYVADEGLPSVPGPSNFFGGIYTQAIPVNNPNAGLQKWVNSRTDGSGTWTEQYVLNNGLSLGVPFSYAIANYPTGTNPATGVPWQPANNGLRTITGQINGDRTVTIYAVTSTISGETDEGADPNQLVVITDNLAATSLPSSESFTVLQEASGLDVIRGVALFQGAPVNPVAASGVDASDATLNGNVNPNGTDTSVYFQYGNSTAYGTTTSPQDIGSVTSPVPFTGPVLSGLQPNTTYDYRLVSVANGVTTVYANQTFTTSAGPTPTPTGGDNGEPAMPPWGLAALAAALCAVAALALRNREKGLEN